MIRRDVLKSMGAAAAGGAGGVTLAQAEAAQAQEAETPVSLGFGPYGTPWDPADPDIPGRQNVVPVSEDYFIPGRFAGKTVIVTGSARGMGEVAARRLAREGANVVGVDILEELGASVIDAINAEGGTATFLGGDIAEDAVCAEMVRLAVDTYGGLDGAINNAGVMDALFPDEPIDYVNQTDRVMARIDLAGDEYFDRVVKVNVYGTFYSMRHEIAQMIAQNRGGAIVNVASVAGIPRFRRYGSLCHLQACGAGHDQDRRDRLRALWHPRQLDRHGHHPDADVRARLRDHRPAPRDRFQGHRHRPLQEHEPAAILRPAEARLDRGRTGGDHAVPAVARGVEHHRLDLQHRWRVHHLLMLPMRCK